MMLMLILHLVLIFSTQSRGNYVTSSNYVWEAMETIIFNKIEYLFFNKRVTWDEARIICLGRQEKLATLDVEDKANFLAHESSESSLADNEFWIGSRMTASGLWIWAETNEKLLPNRLLQENMNYPRYTKRSLDSRHCLTLFRQNHNIPMFIPLRCDQRRPFICEKERVAFEKDVEKLFSVKVKDKNFELFSGKLTWSEAVMMCRQKNLEIAEVTSVSEAQMLATRMLRTRPEAIENAWIGGHLSDGLWKWLASGRVIHQNEMWNNESKNLTWANCLLLDRHICDNPTYLNAQCDRKRNVLCQSPVTTLSQDKPIVAVIDNCRYWIGFNRLKWSEAKKSCQNLNASLVVLDSEKTLNHLINFMIDNREQLQHIWIDGRQYYFKNFESKENKGESVWLWESTGRRIPGPNEKIYVPWCDDHRSLVPDTDCLNFDRENFDTPMVYGLNCNNVQNYVCYERTDSCEKSKDVQNEEFAPTYKTSEFVTQRESTTAQTFEMTTTSTKLAKNETEDDVVVITDSSESIPTDVSKMPAMITATILPLTNQSNINIKKTISNLDNVRSISASVTKVSTSTTKSVDSTTKMEKNLTSTIVRPRLPSPAVTKRKLNWTPENSVRHAESSTPRTNTLSSFRSVDEPRKITAANFGRSRYIKKQPTTKSYSIYDDRLQEPLWRGFPPDGRHDERDGITIISDSISRISTPTRNAENFQTKNSDSRNTKILKKYKDVIESMAARLISSTPKSTQDVSTTPKSLLKKNISIFSDSKTISTVTPDPLSHLLGNEYASKSSYLYDLGKVIRQLFELSKSDRKKGLDSMNKKKASSNVINFMHRSKTVEHAKSPASAIQFQNIINDFRASLDKEKKEFIRFQTTDKFQPNHPLHLLAAQILKSVKYNE